MGSFVLSCESTADYPRSFFEARSIEYIMFHYELDGVVHEDDLYQSVTPEAFFGALKAGSTSKTSQVSVGEYTEFCITLTSANPPYKGRKGQEKSQTQELPPPKEETPSKPD